MRVVITLVHVEITLVRVLKTERVLAKIHLKIYTHACDFTRKRVIFASLRVDSTRDLLLSSILQSSVTFLPGLRCN
jgi:hypothetical protein